MAKLSSKISTRSTLPPGKSLTTIQHPAPFRCPDMAPFCHHTGSPTLSPNSRSAPNGDSQKTEPEPLQSNPDPALSVDNLSCRALRVPGSGPAGSQADRLGHIGVGWGREVADGPHTDNQAMHRPRTPTHVACPRTEAVPGSQRGFYTRFVWRWHRGVRGSSGLGLGSHLERLRPCPAAAAQPPAPSDWLLACLLPGERLSGRSGNQAALCAVRTRCSLRLQSWRARGSRRVTKVSPTSLHHVSALPPEALSGKGAFKLNLR
jgi:hypothetical protein